MTPFMGVGSECYGAVINGRRAVGMELKPSYYSQAIRNLDSIGNEAVTRDLFDACSGDDWLSMDPDEPED